MSGFAILHRRSLDHPLLNDAQRLGAWTWLVLRAAWKPIPFDINGKVVTLQRGQLCASIRQLGDEWGWSKSAVDRFLTRLETETMIVREAGQGKCIITICNYSKYQDMGDDARDSSGTATGTAAGQQRDTKEQGNKVTILEPEGSNGHYEFDLEGESDNPDVVTPRDILDGWNDLAKQCGLPVARKLTTSRLAKAKARLREYPDLADWQTALAHIKSSPFLLGDNREGWKADIDFLLQAKSFTRLVEESYGKTD